MRIAFLLLISTFVFSFTGYSQDVAYFVTSLNYTTSKKEGGATVKVYEGSNLVSTYTTDGKGQVKFYLNPSKTYKIEVSKPGKVTRFVMVDTKGVNDELTQGSSEPYGGVNISLFDELPNVDYSYITQNPITTYFFDGKSAEMTYKQDQASKMIAQVEKIMKDAENGAKKSEADYNAAIKAADAFYAQKKYNEAITEYEKASVAKPKDAYAANQITAITKILKAEADGKAATAQLDNDYKNLITAADALRDQKKYAEAKTKYLDAYAKKPEPYAKAEADKCDVSLANAAKDAENEKKYQEAMALGNTMMGQKSWMAAKDQYKAALKFKPNDAAATAKINEIEGKLNIQAEENKKKAEREKLVTEADELFKAEKYAEAKSKYAQALAMNSGSQYESGQIKICETKIAEAEAKKATQQKIDKLLEEGNTAFTAAKYPDAKLKYQEVLKLDDKNTIALAKISDIDARIAEEKANAQKIADAKKLVAEGDVLAKGAKYNEAIAKYNDAQKVYNDPTVQPKIDAANEALKGVAAAAEKKANFENAIKEGNDLFAAKKYEEAKSKYASAGTIDPSSTLPKTKISEVDKAIAADKAAADKAEADRLAAEKAAKDKAEAERLAAEKAAKDKAEADRLAAEKAEADRLAAEKAAKDKAEAERLAAEKAAKDKAEADRLAAEKAEADRLAAEKAAKDKVEAERLAAEKAAKDKAEADRLAAEKAEADRLAAEKAAKDKAEAERLAAEKAAKDKAEADRLAAEKAEADRLAAEKSAKDKAEAERLAAEKAAKDKAAADQIAADKQAKLEADIASLLKTGDDFVAQKEYEKAISAYSQALVLKNDPAIQKKKDDTQKLKELADETLAGSQYQKILDAAQKSFDEKNYVKAIEYYDRAIANRNSDPFPKTRKAQIEELIKKDAAYAAKIKEADATANAGKLEAAIAQYEDARKIKADEVYPTNRIDELKRQIAEKAVVPVVDEAAAKYQKAMDEGKALAKAKDYTTALAKYQEALVAKPNDVSALGKVAEMKQLIDDQKLASDKDAQLKKLIGVADELFKAEKWLEAKNAYDAALLFDGTDSYSKKQVKLCQDKLDKNEEFEKEYLKVIKAADNNFDKKDYNKSKEYYQRALSFKSNDPYPKRRLKEIELLLNPKPIAVVTPPVNKEPEKLANLGIPSTSTDAEDGEKLGATRKFRHARNRNGVEALKDTTSNAGKELYGIQKDRTTENDQEFATLRSENTQRVDSLDAYRQENRDIIDGTAAEMKVTNDELTSYKSSDITYTQEQLTLIEKDSKESSKVYSTTAVENAEVFVEQQKELTTTNKDLDTKSYEGNILTDVQLDDVKYTQKKNTKDDTQDRQESNTIVEGIAKENDQHNKTMTQDKIADINYINDSLNDIHATINKIDIEDKRLAPVNHDKIKEINKEVGATQKQETADHNQVMLSHKQIIDEDNKNVLASYENAEVQRSINNEEMKEIKVEQTEIDRVNYNNNYVQAVNNKTTLNEGMAVQKEFSKLPSITVAENNAVYESIKDENKTRDTERTAQETDKHNTNQLSLNETKGVTTEQAKVGSEKSLDNTEVLKQKKAGIGEVESAQVDSQRQNSLDVKKELTAIEKTKPVEASKSPNDLGKLYPEGVSQEKFDQTDRNNMVIAIVTRRIVVKDGHGDEFIKTQTLNSVTYTKNGGAITESDWQQETQNAKLKKNY